VNILDWFRGKRRKRRFFDAPDAARGDRPSNVIGTGAQLRGLLTGSGHYIVSGRFEGDGEIEGSVVLMPGACWKGNIAADNIIVAGEVQGDVTAQDKLELTATAHIHGDLAGPTITIAEGAVYEGQVHTAKRGQVKHFKERRDAERTSYLAPGPTSGAAGDKNDKLR